MLENDARSFHLATLAEFMLTKPQIKLNLTTRKNIWERV